MGRASREKARRRAAGERRGRGAPPATNFWAGAWQPQIIEAQVQAARQALGGTRAVANATHFAAASWSFCDQLIAGAITAFRPKPRACRSGCAHCCYTRVEASIPEIIALAEHLKASGRDSKINFAAAAARAREHDEAGNTRHPVCPLLEGDKCSVYEVRPLRCRGWNSFDVGGCRAAWANPAERGRIPVWGEQLSIGETLAAGIERGLRSLDLEHQEVELAKGLDIALRTDDAVRRWLQGEIVFRGDAGTGVEKQR